MELDILSSLPGHLISLQYSGPNVQNTKSLIQWQGGNVRTAWVRCPVCEYLHHFNPFCAVASSLAADPDLVYDGCNPCSAFQCGVRTAVKAGLMALTAEGNHILHCLGSNQQNSKTKKR